MNSVQAETFPALAKLPVRHAFIGRVPGIAVDVDREAALARLEQCHLELLHKLGFGEQRLIIAQQVHGASVAVVDMATVGPVLGVDALITDDPHVVLGIYVADCGPVWIVDPVIGAIGCVHSGRKGTDLGVVPAAIEKMVATYGCDPARMTVQIGPCIRPPHYEVDFAGTIREQCIQAGVAQVFDCGICTASDPKRYYSYRRELGKTGRMLALLSLE